MWNYVSRALEELRYTALRTKRPRENFHSSELACLRSYILRASESEPDSGNDRL